MSNQLVTAGAVLEAHSKRQHEITRLEHVLSNIPKPEKPDSTPDFHNSYHAVLSTLCILSMGAPEGMEHHSENLIAAALPHLDVMLFEWDSWSRESQVRRLKHLKAEAARPMSDVPSRGDEQLINDKLPGYDDLDDKEKGFVHEMIKESNEKRQKGEKQNSHT